MGPRPMKQNKLKRSSLHSKFGLGNRLRHNHFIFKNEFFFHFGLQFLILRSGSRTLSVTLDEGMTAVRDRDDFIKSELHPFQRIRF